MDTNTQNRYHTLLIIDNLTNQTTSLRLSLGSNIPRVEWVYSDLTDN